MTAEEARERVGEIRAELDRAMRALCVPGPDWGGAVGALVEASDMTRDLARLCASEKRKEGMRRWERA